MTTPTGVTLAWCGQYEPKDKVWGFHLANEVCVSIKFVRSNANDPAVEKLIRDEQKRLYTSVASAINTILQTERQAAKEKASTSNYITYYKGVLSYNPLDDSLRNVMDELEREEEYERNTPDDDWDDAKTVIGSN